MNTETNNKKKGSDTMIEKVAIVKRVSHGYADVLSEGGSVCSACSSNSECASSFSIFSLLFNRKPDQQSIRVYNPVYAKPGDKVVVGIKPNTLLKGSILAYMAPLLMLLVSAVLGNELFSLLGMNPEIGSILLGISGLFAGFKLVALWMQRALSSAEYEAVILRVVEPPQTQTVSFSLST